MSLSMAARLIQFSALASMATMTNVTQSLPSLAYSCAQMQENEAKAAKASGLEMWTLMSRAGQAAYHTLRVHLLQGTKPNHITVLAGKGNNGGDGYVVAEAALKDDINVLLGQVGDHMSLKGDAATARDRFLAAGGVITPIDDAFTIPDDTDAIVDGLFGTGLSREIRQGPFTRAIDLASKSKAKKLAIDIPSGLHGDTGNVLGTVLSADATITFIGVKKGQFTGKAPQHVGILYFAGLGVEQAFDEIVSSPAAELVAFNRVRHRFMPLRPLAAHKAAFGKVVLLGGNNGMSGAIRLAGEACQRTGSGLTRTLTHPASQQAVMFGRPELMVTAAQDVNAFSHWIDWATVLAVGPGLGQDDWAQGVLRLFLKHASKPSVVDADALNLLAKSPQHNPHWVLTPHPGEAGRLLGISSRDVEANRFLAAEQIQETYGGVVLLKGAGTIVTDGTRTRVVVGGNPGMAVGGSGDLLTGIIAGLLAQGFDQFDAAVIGACLHAEAGDHAAMHSGERGLLPSDLLPHIHQLVNPNRRLIKPYTLA